MKGLKVWPRDFLGIGQGFLDLKGVWVSIESKGVLTLVRSEAKVKGSEIHPRDLLSVGSKVLRYDWGSSQVEGQRFQGGLGVS